MGERCDNLARTLDDTDLNWDAVLGGGFAGAPERWVSVYRECSPEELARIARQGLSVPPPEARPPEVRREMDILDGFRPPAVIERGISRLQAIYAVPTPEAAPRLPFRQSRCVLELKVDPAESYVGDMDFITCLIPFIETQHLGLDRYQGAFRRYWESVISLTDFRRFYVRSEAADGRWVRGSDAPGPLPKDFFAPEILIMTPKIERGHIRVARSGTDDGI